MHELVDLGHSMMHAVVGLCRDETRTSEHIGISPAEGGWTVANDNGMYLVAALTCNVLQHSQATQMVSGHCHSAGSSYEGQRAADRPDYRDLLRRDLSGCCMNEGGV
jgi:hypothetical protein